MLSDDNVRRLLADRSGEDLRDRRDLAIIRLFLDTGMRLEGMAGLRYRVGDPEASDVDLRSRVVRSTAKGRRELVLPIGTKSARDIDRYSRVRAGHPHAADPWLWLGYQRPAHSQRRLPEDQRPRGRGRSARSAPAPATAHVPT